MEIIIDKNYKGNYIFKAYKYGELIHKMQYLYTNYSSSKKQFKQDLINMGYMKPKQTKGVDTFNMFDTMY